MPNKNGFTLVEVLIATVLFVILVFGMFQFSSVLTTISKKSQAEISINQILYNIKTAITSSAARRATSEDTYNAKLKKCVNTATFDPGACKGFSSEISIPYAEGILLKDANGIEVAKGDPGALSTIATRYDDLGSVCTNGSILPPGVCPLFAQAFFKTLCIDSSASCGSINETIIIIHYRVLIDPNLPNNSPFKSISPNTLSSFRSGKITATDENPHPQLLLSFPAGYFNY